MNCIYSNYYARKIHVSGLKFDPYTVTRGSIVFANGKTFLGNSEGRGPAPARMTPPPVLNIPFCGDCCGR